MSNIIPPLVSSSPPPMVAGEPDDLDDDEFGDFAAATDLSFEGYSLPTTPQHASYSSFPTTTSTESTFPSPTTNITLPKTNHVKIKDHFSFEPSCNGQTDDHLVENLTKETTEYKISSDSSENFKHIFCDIKSDVYIEENETSFVNSSTEIQDDINSTLITNTQHNTFVQSIDNSVFQGNDSIVVPRSNLQTEVNQISTTKLSTELADGYCDIPRAESIKCSAINANDAVPGQINQDAKIESESLNNKDNFAESAITANTHDFGDFNCFSSGENIKIECQINSEESKIEISESTTIFSNVIIDNLELPRESDTNELTKISKCLIETSISEGDVNILTNDNSIISEEKPINNIDTKVLETDKAAVFNESEQFESSAINVLLDEQDELKTLEINDASISSVNKIEIENAETLEESKIEDSEDEFTNFETAVDTNNKPETDFTNLGDQLEFDDFKDATDAVQQDKSERIVLSTELNDDIDDFGDFDDFQFTATPGNSLQSNQTETTSDKQQQNILDSSYQDDGDDFGDFNDYSTQDDTANVDFSADFTIPSYDTPANAEKIIEEIFAYEETKEPECQIIDFKNNGLFKHVQDIENTNALGYHWTNSESQKTMLRALNIDSRNILFGPRWNASMPRFAANLGFTPLEPVKTEISPGSTLLQTPITPQPQPEVAPCDVPAAKFDWTSSGLVNPLDSQTNETVKLETIEDKLSVNLNQKSDVLKHSISDIANNPQLDLNILGNLPQSDNESVNSLKFIESSVDIENELKLEADNISNEKSSSGNVISPVSEDDDFTSFQSSKPEAENTWTPNLVPLKLPLRETHISSPPEITADIPKNPGFNIEPFVLESTIVTPEPARKTITTEVADDDFTDFQMSLPQPKKSEAEFVAAVPFELLKPIVLETSSVISNAPTQINWPEPGVVSDDLNEFELNFTSNIPKDTQPQEVKVEQDISVSIDVEKNKVKAVASVPEEDDWSDFVCVQEPTRNEIKSVKAEPKAIMTQDSSFLKPTKSQNPYQNTNNFSNLFQNATNPISQLELSVPNLQNTQLKHTVLPPTFIPNSSPIKTLNSQPSTQQIAAQQVTYGYRPPYQIPLQTINTPFGGLPQTSLSTYNHFTVGPTELTPQKSTQEKKSISAEFGIFDGPFTTEMKPFQSYNTPVQHESQYQHPVGYQLQSVESTFLKMQVPAKEFLDVSNAVQCNAQDDDDDWTDFVSSQPTPSNNINGLSNMQQRTAINNFSKPPVMTNWNSEITPNIIANPVHFEAFQSYQAGPSQDSKNVNSKKSGNMHQTQIKSKSSVPSISALPDLDFIAPKNKFFSKK